MTAFIRSFLLAAVLAAGAAWAQQPQAPGDNPTNPHSTKAKDKQSSGVSGSTTNSQVDQAEKPNPHSVEHNRSQDAKASGESNQANIDAAETQNPHSVDERTHQPPSGAMQGQTGGMDHEAMMKNATPPMMLQTLHMSDLHEIEMAKMAEQNGSDRVKTYAQTLITDHTAADKQVKDLAKKKNVSLSDTPRNPQMKQRMDAANQHFSTLHGPQFDHAFANRMAMEHQRMITMAQSWRKNCSDQDVCNLIDTLLPKLQQHEQMANQLRAPAAQGRTPEATPR
jgi:putative membrane protein